MAYQYRSKGERAKYRRKEQRKQRFTDKQRAAYWKAKYLACRADLTAHQRVNSRRWNKR